MASLKALLEDGSALFSESYGVSGMFGTSAAQVCQRVSIIWLSLPFLFALVGAYFALSDAPRNVCG